MDELLRSVASGSPEHVQELTRDTRVLFQAPAPRRAKRTTMEW
jgi:hypothetical protein